MVKVEEVWRSFGELHAVRGVSFDVRPGEIVGLLGPNGAGKTTLMRMIATLLRPNRGRILVGGHDVVCDPLAARAALGYQTAETGLYPRLTPRETLAFFGELHGMRPSDIQERAASLIARLDMASFADRPCNTLSTGQRQRTSLARTLLHRPPVLLLDEATSGLDLVSSAFLLRALREAAADEGSAVLFSTHLMSEVELLCDRVIVLREGAVVATGTASELCAATASPSLSLAFLRLVGAEDADAARLAARSASVATAPPHPAESAW